MGVLLAKIVWKRISWAGIWISIPIVSWLSINGMVQASNDVSGGGGGFYILVSLLLGWAYMIPPFLFCLLIYGVIFWATTSSRGRKQSS